MVIEYMNANSYVESFKKMGYKEFTFIFNFKMI